uniref:Heparan sulphate-N-deacetylase domain-containing protein n=1 Tax=Romanomermis culicivorax TaxID=13658 RepID=A0A915KHI4_ROMCU
MEKKEKCDRGSSVCIVASSSGCIGSIATSSQRRRYAIVAILILCVMLSIFNINHKESLFAELWRESRRLYNPLQADSECAREDTMRENFQPTPVYDDGKSGEMNSSGPILDARILFFVESRFTQFGAQISFVLDSLKIPFKAQTLEKWLPTLTEELNSRRSFYKIIIFENLYKYLNLAPKIRQTLDEYCKIYNVGIIAFMSSRPDSPFARAKMKGFPVYIRQNLKISRLYMNAYSDFYYLTKVGNLPDNILNQSDPSWVGFEYSKRYYESILRGAISEPDLSSNTQNISLALLDEGKYDGIRKLLFGNKFNSLWILKLLFVDAIKFLSENIFGLSLVRYLQIDIDDIFVGEKSKKMTADDVKLEDRNVEIQVAIRPVYVFRNITAQKRRDTVTKCSLDQKDHALYSVKIKQSKALYKRL